MYRKFIKNLFLFTLLLSLLTVTINFFVDPYNVQPVAQWEGFNQKKMENNTRLVVAWNAIRYQAKTIVLGTSRAAHIEQQSMEKFCEGPCFNSAICGAYFDEMYAYFLHALYQQPDLKSVIIGLDLFSFNIHGKCQKDYREERLQTSDWNCTDLKEVLYTLKAFCNSCKCLYYSYTNKNPPNFIVDMGDQTYLERTLTSNQFYKDFKIDPEKIQKFQSLVEICQTKGIDLKVFICPVRACYWEFYYQNGLWPHVEDLKRQICAIHPLWDFSGFNPITTETLDSGGENLYIECSHFTPYTAGLLVKRMFGETSPIDQIGYLLTPETVESSLKEILDQRNCLNQKSQEKITTNYN